MGDALLGLPAEQVKPGYISYYVCVFCLHHIEQYIG